MKKNKGKYKEVTTLPDNAVTVAAYAKENGYTTNYIYNMLRDNKHLDRFEVVIFQSFNFIIPK